MASKKCISGVMCANPDETKRPTILRFKKSGENSYLCSYCLKVASEKINLSSLPKVILELGYNHEDTSAPLIVEAPKIKKRDFVEGDMVFEPKTPNFIEKLPHEVVTILNEKKTFYDKSMMDNVIDFLSSENIPDYAKKTFVDEAIESFGIPRLVNSYHAGFASGGKYKVTGLWSNPDEYMEGMNLSERVKKYVRYATLNCDPTLHLKSQDTIMSVAEVGDKEGKGENGWLDAAKKYRPKIRVNVYVASLLTKESFIMGIAHEAAHAMLGHNHEHVKYKDKQLINHPLYNLATDMVVNKALGVESLNYEATFDDPDNSALVTKYVFLMATCIGGSRAVFDEFRQSHIPLVTFNLMNKKYGLNLTGDESIQEILEILDKAGITDEDVKKSHEL